MIQDNNPALFLNQSGGESTDNWKPLSTEPLPINLNGFSGSYDDYPLNEYVGAKKWKLRVPSTAKAGQYTGQVTWSIEDSLQNL